LRRYRIGRYFVPLWLLAIILVSTFSSVFAYVFYTLNINVQIQEPLDVVYYSHDLSLFAGETQPLDIEIYNGASINYTVTLDFHLSNTTYQSAYATFSKQTYIVVPGSQSLPAWIKIAADAPAENVTLTVNLSRGSYPPS
jgi:hypothetical protein